MGVMDERSSRIFVGVCLLVLLWIGTYWLYEPGRPASQADVSFDPIPVAQETPEPTPTVVKRPTDPITRPEPNPEIQAPVVLGPKPRPEDQAQGTPGADGPRVIPPKFRDYAIRSGDSFESIARDQLGSSSLWTAIANANPLKDPRRLRVGEVIRVPLDPDNIQGKVVGGEREGETSDPAGDRATAVEYTVRPGDSLTGIARSYYGSVRFADAIFEANKDRLSSPDALRVGQVLMLPPLGDAEGGSED